MPIRFCYAEPDRSARWALAARQVRAKFPNLMQDSAGWDRAVRNRFNRLRG